MRKILNEQLKIGTVEIGKKEIDLKSRESIPKVLQGLQCIDTYIKESEDMFQKVRKHHSAVESSSVFFDK